MGEVTCGLAVLHWLKEVWVEVCLVEETEIEHLARRCERCIRLSILCDLSSPTLTHRAAFQRGSSRSITNSKHCRMRASANGTQSDNWPLMKASVSAGLCSAVSLLSRDVSERPC